ncbi:putative beta-glucosidase L [Phyllosticta citrichinensis]|uniref:beta-glucosidase n=1 Tax=Phyllosticta citrichinensis TaxID=1130410 RepID=A0ABR1XZY5_9PEZI
MSCFLTILALALLGDAAVLDWTTSYAKASSALQGLTVEEKVGIVTGIGWQKGPCVGNTSPVPKIGLPSLCLQDGPLGVRFVQGTTAFPAGIHAGATWDKDLVYQRGAAMGEESRALGIHVQLSPVGGALGKIPEGGRKWEGFTNDAYLSGILMQQTIMGLQSSGVQACAKHPVGNEQEKNRETMSSNIDDRTLHELYMWPFADSVLADVASMMCSYNKLNGTWACESDKLLNALLKDDLDFRGYIMSDWNAQHSSVQSALTGLDMSMPGTDYNGGSIYWGPSLTELVKNGTVPQTRLDNMVTRILAGWYKLQQDQNYPRVTFNSWTGGTGGPNVQSSHSQIARQVARDGIILLKNDRNTLPLRPSGGSIAVIGSDAITNPDGLNACKDKGCNNGTLTMGWGSGSVELPYLIDPLSGIRNRLSGTTTNVIPSTTDDKNAAAGAAAAASMSIVFVNSNSGEAYITVEGNAGDRINLDPYHDGNGLVGAVAAAAGGKPVIVVIHSVGPMLLESILSHPNVVAVVWAGLPGQESGSSLADVLFGDYSPSAKLPFTIGKSRADYGDVAVETSMVDSYEEGLYIDYRHFDKMGITPRYEFGYGLSYTNFTYSALAIQPATAMPTGLYDTIAVITCTITNIGPYAGAEVAQLYLSLPPSAPDSPVQQLRGFDKVKLAPGQAGTATFVVRKKDASYWDVPRQQWVIPPGEHRFVVGASSRDRKLQGGFVVQ